MFMYLQPGEVFEHLHNDQSITMLVEGKVDLECGGTRAELVVGLPTPVDANLPHRLINVGTQPAMVKCVHVRIDH
jgi:mannose-6-phosphate isomerase-like protein (cupin superfamily)